MTQSAFSGCKNLTTVTLNSNEICSKEYEYRHGLAYCFGSQVKEYIIGEEVKGISIDAFHGCTDFTKLTLNSNEICSGSQADYYIFNIKFGNKIKELVIGDNITNFCTAFAGYTSLESVTISNSMTYINDDAFKGCRNLTSVTIPNSVTTIGAGAFEECSSLTSITIPESVTNIGENAFRHCYNLTSVEMPNSVKEISPNLFYGCYDLESITIPNSVTTIGAGAFVGCSSLTSVEIPQSVTSIIGGAFQYCDNLTKVTLNSNEICSKDRTPDYSLAYKFGIQVKEYIIGEAVKGIGKNAFTASSSLETVTIPNSVTTIGDEAFSFCTSLASITIPNSVTSIGTRTFYNCTNLTSIEIPNSVKTIARLAFSKCSLIETIKLGSSVETIDQSAFDGCTALKDVYCEAKSVPSTSKDVFDNCDLSNSILHVPSASLSFYQETVPWKYFGRIIALGALEECYSPLATDGETVQYMLNIDAKAFMLGANEWSTRASVSTDQGYKVKVKANGDGTYTINDFVERYSWTGNAWNALDCQDAGEIWVDGQNRGGWNQWVITPVTNDYIAYEITNKNVPGKLGVKSDLSDTRLYINNDNGNFTRWAFMDEEGYNNYLQRRKEEIERENQKKLDLANKNALAVQKKLITGTNVYEIKGFNAYVDQYSKYIEQLEAGTLMETVVNPNSATVWHASTEYNFLLTPWTFNGEDCNNFNKPLYVNTWSVEGEQDGSNFLVPFMEYWTDDANSLNAATIGTEISSLREGDVYDVNILARIRTKNGADSPQGIALTIGNGESVNLCSGERIEGTQFYMAQFTASGTVDANGNLSININIAGDNNISWLAFKDVTYTFNMTDTEANNSMSISDVNADGQTNISDVTNLVNIILGKDNTSTGASGSKLKGDVNGDGVVNISDVTALVNIILGKGTGSGSTAKPKAVDLGLSVKWADMNIGASSPEDYGYYFAWGAAKPQEIHSWMYTPYIAQTTNRLSSTRYTKYLGSTTSPRKDSKATDADALKTVLAPEDDAAHVNWGGEWRMPTKEEQEELRTQCTWEWTERNGKTGCKVTGPNGNSIFLPAAGIREDRELYDTGETGFYWSSSLYTNAPIWTYGIMFDSGNTTKNTDFRYLGQTIRAVCP